MYAVALCLLRCLGALIGPVDGSYLGLYVWLRRLYTIPADAFESEANYADESPNAAEEAPTAISAEGAKDGDE